MPPPFSLTLCFFWGGATLAAAVPQIEPSVCAVLEATLPNLCCAQCVSSVQAAKQTESLEKSLKQVQAKYAEVCALNAVGVGGAVIVCMCVCWCRQRLPGGLFDGFFVKILFANWAL